MGRSRPHRSRETGNDSHGDGQKTLATGLLRKPNSLDRSVGEGLGEKVLAKWVVQQTAASAPKSDPVAAKIEVALTGFANEESINLGSCDQVLVTFGR